MRRSRGAQQTAYLTGTPREYRRAHSKADRARFQADAKTPDRSLRPGICKRSGMSDRTFDKLEWQLTKEHIRYLRARRENPIPNSTTRTRCSRLLLRRHRRACADRISLF